jgi:hypothetical protein
MDPFITNEEFLDRYDWRWVARNILDGDTVSGSATPPTLTQLLDPLTNDAGARLEQLIIDASEELMSGAAVGARYSEADLRRRPLDSPPYAGGGNLLVSIVAGLTLGPLLERRGRAVTDQAALSAAYDRAKGRVEELRRGERIFWSVPLVPEAGLPATADMFPTPPLGPPSLSEQAGRYFGYPAGGCGPYPPPWCW